MYLFQISITQPFFCKFESEIPYRSLTIQLFDSTIMFADLPLLTGFHEQGRDQSQTGSFIWKDTYQPPLCACESPY